jgi:hypothetical protein
LGHFGKKRGVRSAKKLNSYITEKLEMFLDERANTAACDFMNANRSSQSFSYVSQSSFMSEFCEDDGAHKVLVVTVACSTKMQDVPGIWDDLKECLLYQFERMDGEVTLCLNIYNEGQF